MEIRSAVSCPRKLTYPILLKGGTEEWSNWDIWTPNYLRNVVGHRPIPVEIWKAGDRDGLVGSSTMLVRDYIELQDDCNNLGDRMYAAEIAVSQFLPELYAAIPKRFDFTGLRSDMVPFIYFGRNSFTPFHYHERTSVALMQMFGSKKILLGPPNRLKAEKSWLSYQRNFAKVNLDGWISSHAVYGGGTTVSITLSWRASIWELDKVKAVRSIGPLIAEASFLRFARLVRGTRYLNWLCTIAQRLGAVKDGRRLADEIRAIGSGGR